MNPDKPTANRLTRRQHLIRQHPIAGLAIAFGAGLLLGWWLIGWILVPVEWTDASPADLHPSWQRTYVGLVVSAYQSERDLEAARSRLVSLEAPDLQAALSAVATQAVEPELRRGAVELGARLGLDVPEAATGPPPTDTGQGASFWGLSRILAALALGAAFLAALALAWLWLKSRRGQAIHGDSAEVPANFAPPSRTQERDERTTPWRPERIELGSTVTTRYESQATRFHQTWLVYDSEGRLVGGAGLQVRDVANVNVLEVWFFERSDDGEGRQTPLVTIVSEAAHGDKLFRARLGDREVLPAVDGAGTVLATDELSLVVEVANTRAVQGADALRLAALSLSLTPVRSETPDEGQDPTPDDALRQEPSDPLPFSGS